MREHQRQQGGATPATEPAPAAARNGVLQLLDREPPTGYVQEWTSKIAEPEQAAEPDTDSVLVFRVGVEWLALPTALVQEVTDFQALHTIPHRRGGALLGLVSVRGDLLICVSVGAVLGIENTPQPGQSGSARLLVIAQDVNRVAFPVDEVHGVHRYSSRTLKPLPATLDAQTGIYTLGLLPWRDDRTVACLDSELLLYSLQKSLS